MLSVRLTSESRPVVLEKTHSGIKPPGPKGSPILGNIPQMQGKGLIDFYYDLWKQYGDVVSIKLGPLKSYLFVRPEHVQHILVKNPETYIKGLSHDKLRTAIGNGILTLEGLDWRSQRKLMQPTYTPTNISAFADLMLEEAENMLSRWRSTIKPGDQVDINSEITRMTMSVISRAMFGVDIGENFREAANALVEMLNYTSSSTISIIDMPLFVPTPKNQRLKQAKQTMKAFISNVVEKRRREGLGPDLLSMLMSAKDADTGELMNDEQLHDEVLITFFAGRETTATLLTWTLFNLSKNPSVEAKLHSELQTVLAGRRPTLADMQNLPYTRMILDETLRLYSPVAMVARDTTTDDMVDNFAIPSGSMVIVMPYITHRHPEFWEKPLEYYPEHFLPEQVAKRPRYAYYPFGAGQRICIGMHFALMEAMLILAEVAQRYQLRLATENDGTVKYIGVIRPASPIMMTMEAR